MTREKVNTDSKEKGGTDFEDKIGLNSLRLCLSVTILGRLIF